MISYCIAAYRPTYTRLLVQDLLRKSKPPFEVLLWLNLEHPSFEGFLGRLVRSGEPVRIVGVVCEGRAKKVGLGLLLLKIRQWGKGTLGLRTRRIELSRVAIVGGTKALFGRRSCRVGFNVADRAGLQRALEGEDTFMRL